MPTLNRVTITGADDSIDPDKLAELSTQYPFVEWGILLSQKNCGTARYPSINWLRELSEIAQVKTMNISLHLCGAYARSVVRGESAIFEFVFPWLVKVAQRVQLNIHTQGMETSIHGLAGVIRRLDRDLIYQYDPANSILMSNVKIQMLQEQTKRIVPLFDSSDGRGISPEKWPTPEGWSKEYGYAGGIGPDNVWQALYEIQKAIAQYVRDGYVPFWIDMETKVRSDDKFSLVKVNYVLAACQRWREQEG